MHTIEKGQSLYSIASMYGVAQAEIIKLNPGSETQIYAGRQLRIPINPRNSQKETFHTIKSGETLYALSHTYNVSVKSICDANPGLSANNFRAGTVIRIPNTETPPATTVSPSPDTTPDTTNVSAPVRPNCRDMHKVKRRETIYGISRKYGITQAELIAANPELKGQKKLKRGSFLCIPYPTDSIAPQAPKPLSDHELFAQNQKETQKMATIKAAVLLPFLSNNEAQGETARMIEYYEGFLLAIDSLKRSNVSIDLYTYNTPEKTSSLNSILAKKEMKDMDIIFGPMYQQQIKPLADFAHKNNIRLVIPFTSKDNTVFQNPSVYQVNTPQSYLYSEVYDHFTRQFPSAHVIFLEAEQHNGDKADFIKGLKNELRSRSIPTTTLNENASIESLKQALRTDRPNIFIPTSGSHIILNKVLPSLRLLTRENPEYTIQLFGYPEWQTYTKDFLETFFELDTYFYSSFYTNNLLPAAQRFTSQYRKWYGKEMEERYPKYGMLGFDTGFFFLKGLSTYGNQLEEHVQQMDLIPVQTGFKFQRVNTWGGFINKKVFFVHFTKNYELIKLDFD